MTTFGELKQIIIRMLGDEESAGASPIEGTAYSAELLQDAIHGALDAILPWVWKRSTSTLAASTSVFTLPADFYRVEAIWDSTSELYLSPTLMAPGQAGPFTGENGWYEYPEGSLTLYTALDTDGGKLYYAAKWTKPTSDATALETPAYATTGIALWACSYCQLPKATLASDLGQYKRRMDSGDPTDNPLIDMSTYFLKRFDIEMTRMPLRARGVLA